MPPNTIFLTTTNPSPTVAGTTRPLLAALSLVCTLYSCNGGEDGASGGAISAGMAGMAGMSAPTGGIGETGGETGGAVDGRILHALGLP